MGARDTKKVAKRDLLRHEMNWDAPPSKSIRQAKRKERQDGKKTIRKERKLLGK